MSSQRYRSLVVFALLPVLMTPGNHFQKGATQSSINLSIFQNRVIQQQSAPLDTSIYVECAKTGTDREKQLINNLLLLYRQFSGTTPDTTVFAIGDIDGNGLIDTLQTRIYMDNEDVHVLSRWIALGEEVWEFDLVNPYSWISNKNPELYAWDIRNPWIVFAVAVFEAQPVLLHPETITGVTIALASRSGLWELRRLGQSVSEEEYQNYLRNYNGLILEYGHIDPSRNLGIWYAPLRRFISYYSP